jgi:hypothetical protein
MTRLAIRNWNSLGHADRRVISLTLSEENRKAEQKYESLTVKMGYATVHEDDHGLQY